MKHKRSSTVEKKTHEVKNNVISDSTRRIVYLSNTYAGSVHDKKICDFEPLSLPESTNLYQDSGFAGHAPRKAKILMPIKKPKGKELTEEEKVHNKAISKVRVLIEHSISGVKRCRIVKDRLRNWKQEFADTVMLIACGLHNLRITFR